MGLFIFKRIVEYLKLGFTIEKGIHYLSCRRTPEFFFSFLYPLFYFLTFEVVPPEND